MKKISEHIVKWLAILMSVVYLLTPLQNEVVEVMYFVAHNFSKPNFILSHDYETNLQNSSSTSDLVIRYHEHKFVDVVNEMLGDETSDNDTKLPSLEDIKIDKHFCVSKYDLLKKHLFKKMASSYVYKEKLKSNFCKKEKIPPKVA